MNAAAALDPPPAAWRDRARTWVESPAELRQLDAADTRALAWALKDLGYAAWNSDPTYTQRVSVAAIALARTAPAAAQEETAALADWLAGIADLTRGRMSDAAGHFDAAAVAFSALGMRHAAAQTRVPLMMALSVLGRHADALACGGEAERALREAGDRLGAGKVNLNLGNLHVRCNAYATALHHYRRASVLFARAGDHEHSVMADLGAGDARAAQGQFDDALHLYERARQRGEHHRLPVLATMACESAALVQLARGHFRDALTGLEDARARYASLRLPQPLAVAEKQLADAYLELHLLPEAQALFEGALVRFGTLEMPVEAAWTHVQAARAHALQSHPADEVQAHLMQAQRLFESQQVPLGQSTVQLARAEQALAGHDGALALTLAQAAATGFNAADAADAAVRADLLAARARLALGDVAAARTAFDDVAARAAQLGSLAAQAQARAGTGRAAWLQGDASAAADALTAAVDALELQRAALPDDTLREAFLADELEPYQGLLRMALAEADGTPRSAGAVQVLQRLEAFRARALDDRQRGAKVLDIDREAGAARERLDWLYRRALRQREEGDSTAAAWTEIGELERQLAEQLRRRHMAEAARARSLPAAVELDVAALRRQLQDGDAVVEYGALDDELFAVVLTRDGVHLVRRMAAWTPVVEAVRALRFQIDTLRMGDRPLHRHMTQLAVRARTRAQHLHAMLWAPLADELAAARRVLVVPHGVLAGVPFAALHDGESYMVERLTLASAPSARSALRGLMHRPPGRPQHALALGDDARLPHAGPEALAAARAYARGCAQVGAGATLQALRENAAGAEVLHLACHGEFRTDNPAFSLLHLADGALTVEAAARLPLGPCTVVLGACESARATSGDGDEAIGFVRGFLQAGAARVVASLWPVADDRNAPTMALLHGAMARGAAPATALRDAQLAALRDQPHPFHWAGYAVHGGW